MKQEKNNCKLKHLKWIAFSGATGYNIGSDIVEIE